MLSCGDLALARRDAQIPGLAVVLDPDEVLALAARSGGTPAVAARATYVRYKPATSCVVGYELATTAGPVFVYAKAHARVAAAKLHKAKVKAVRDERWDAGTTSMDEHLVMLAPASSDRDLPALRVLADPDRRARLLRRLLPSHPDLWCGEPRAIRHKPERRWVGVAERSGQPVAVIKAYRTADFLRSRNGQRHLATPLGRPLGWSERRAAVASAWVPGTTLAALLQADPAAGTRGAGVVLAALHATPPPGGIRRGGRRVDAALGPASAAVCNVLPHLEARARRLASETRSIGITDSAHRCVLHGDFSADQVIVSDGAAHLIDLDQAHVADPAADLASFGAALIRAEIEGRLRPGRAAELLDCLVAEHERAGGPEVRPRLAVHLAAALLRLAVAPFRERHADWPALCEALVREAERAAAASLRLAGPAWG